MKITFLIGNGFDINLKMATSYGDFYKYYKQAPSLNEHIGILKKAIDEDYENWSDLEIALGKYTVKFEKTDQYYPVLSDIRKQLARYIRDEEDKYAYDKEHKDKLCQDFVSPEEYLTRAEKNAFLEYRNKWRNSDWNINVISFNYSKTLENLLAFNGNMLSLPGHIYSNTLMSSKLLDIKHIHGFTDKDMVLGVNDPTQILNEEFRSDPYFLDALVKSECNRSMEHLIDQDCRTVINESNLICLFGLSIGDTDKMWWELIGKKLKQNDDFRLLFFEHSDIHIDSLDSWMTRQIKDQARQKFLSQTNLADTEKESVMSKIFVGYNTNIFKVDLKKVNVNKNSKQLNQHGIVSVNIK